MSHGDPHTTPFLQAILSVTVAYFVREAPAGMYPSEQSHRPPGRKVEEIFAQAQPEISRTGAYQKHYDDVAFEAGIEQSGPEVR